VIFRRGHFADTISRQLDLFAEDEATGLLAEVQELDARYRRAERDEAEEAFGDYSDAVDAVIDALADMRDRFASTLDEPDEYERAFEDAARKRWRWLDR
jgi:phosphoglycolate phosphatase-like HAD superfamily hydrolase